MNTPSKWPSIIGHGAAALLVVALPLLMTGLPEEWQTLTLAAVLGALLKWAHLYLAE